MIPPESFVLRPDYNGTLQQQIQELVAQGILTGRFRPGEKMPSSRQLAAQLGVSRITVTLAYTELVSNDYLTSRDRSGYFISDAAPLPPPPSPQKRATRSGSVDWTRALGQRFSRPLELVRPVDWRRYKFPFIYGQADAALFDHQSWRQCALKALGQRDFDAMTSDYYDRDDAGLIDFMIRHILPRRGIMADPDTVLLTLGAQNALWIAAQILLTQRRTAVIEAPCYPGFREIVQQTRCKTVAVPVDAEGLPPGALPDDVDVVFATPSHHSPTNATMPVERRRALLDRAARDGFIIVEDDYEFEMSFAQSSSPALKSLDDRGAVIYIGSFSKSVFPGLRLGYLVGPEPFIREARALRSLVLRHPPGHIQRTLAYFLSLGHFDAQVRRMGKVYAERRKVMAEAIAKTGLEMAAPGSNGGSSFWMRAPEGVDTSAIAMSLREESVLIEPGQAFFGADETSHSHYRLAYSSIPASRIEKGIELIGSAIS